MSGQTTEIFFKGYGIIFELDNISIYAKAVYLYLCKCKNNKTNTCFPCHYQMAKSCGCGITKIKSAIKELELVKLIKKKHRFLDSKKGKLSQTSNEYTIYSQPYDQVAVNEIEDREEVVKTVVVEPVKNNMTATPSQYDYETKVEFNNKSNNSISINLVNSNKEPLIDSLDYIFKNCMLEKYDKPLQEILLSTIINMYSNITNFSKRKKIPLEIVQGQLNKLNIQVTDVAISNYRYALEQNFQIDNYNLYFESVLWNSIINSYVEQVRMDNVG